MFWPDEANRLLDRAGDSEKRADARRERGTARVIDLHTHVLPGIDDGPPSVEESVAMVAAAEQAGTTTVVATPHVSWEFPTTAETMRRAVSDFQSALRAAGVRVGVQTGAEVGISLAAELDDEELHALHIGGGDWLLVECPLSASAVGFENVLHQLQARGHRIVLAHPERSPILQAQPKLLRTLVDAGMLTSVTASALTGRFGRPVQRFTYALVEEGLVHNIASDGHDARKRPPHIRDAITSAARDLHGLAERAEWMTLEVPRAILDGEKVPEAPTPAPRRKRRLFRR